MLYETCRIYFFFRLATFKSKTKKTEIDDALFIFRGQLDDERHYYPVVEGFIALILAIEIRR